MTKTTFILEQIYIGFFSLQAKYLENYWWLSFEILTTFAESVGYLWQELVAAVILKCFAALAKAKQANKDEKNSSATVRRKGTWPLFSTLRVESIVVHGISDSEIKSRWKWWQDMYLVSNSKLEACLEASSDRSRAATGSRSVKGAWA